MKGPYTVIWIDGENRLSKVFYNLNDARAFANSQMGYGYKYVRVCVNDY